MKNTRRILVLLCTILTLTLAPAALGAENEPAQTTNLNGHNYGTYGYAAEPVNAYLVDNGDGTFTRVEYTGEDVTVEIYDSNFQFVSGSRIAMELPLFGGFYAGSDSNFLIFGQKNLNEDDSVEVIRVVRYSKDWQRLSSVGLFGGNTYIPFDSGSLRCVEYNGYLYVRTAHEMYNKNGVNHQANMTLNIRLSDMTITDSQLAPLYSTMGYASHSFNQFILVDDGQLITADHGDAYPRSVRLTRYLTPAGQDLYLIYTKYTKADGTTGYAYGIDVDVLPIAGTIGDNTTGVCLGGFEASSTAYLTCGTTVDHGENYNLDGQRNLFITATSKTDFTSAGTTINYLTSYTSDAGVTLSNPHLVKLSADRFAVLWTETGSDNAGLRIAFVDGTGNLEGEIVNVDGALSDCKPIVSDNRLIWYVTSASVPAFMVLDLNDPASMVHSHVYQYSVYSYPGKYRDGSLSSVCAICGEAGPAVEIPSFQHYDAYNIIVNTQPTCTTSGQGRFVWKDTEKYAIPTLIFTVTMDPLGHDLSFVGGEPATCTATGLADYWSCSRCTLKYADSAATTEITDLTLPLDPENHSSPAPIEAVEPDCTNPGLTEGCLCEGCGQTMVAQEVVPATGHSYDAGTHLCACGAEDPAYVIPTIIPAAFSLSFESEVLVNLYYTVDNINRVAAQGMLIFHQQPETVSVDTAATVCYGSGTPNESGLFHVQSNSIAAKEMGDDRYYAVFLQLTDGSYVYSNALPYSPKTYAMNQLEHSDSENLKALCVAMLNYGAAAQQAFSYKTDSLMNADLEAAHLALPTPYDSSLFTGAVAADETKTVNFQRTEPGFSSRSASVSFEGALSINFYFAPNDDVDSEVTFYYWNREDYVNSEVLTADNATGTLVMTQTEDGAFWAQIAGIAAKNFDDTYYAAACYTCSGETRCTGVIAYSISRYCMNNASKQLMGPLAQSAAMYGYHAKLYFTS